MRFPAAARRAIGSLRQRLSGRRREVMIGTAAVLTVAVGVALALTVPSGESPQPTFSPPPAVVGGIGSDGIGDSYFPQAGNGGYDVKDYDLDVLYDPQARRLQGVATVTAVATDDLKRFNLDFRGLTIESITVDGVAARSDRPGGSELVVTPATPLPAGATFTTVVTYGGVPELYDEPAIGETGFLTSADGVVVIGQPEVAASWFPVNDHPRDKATYTIHISAPSELAALSNGVLVSREPAERPGYTTSTWRVSSPMAPYLATMVVGNYRVVESTHDGLPVVLAVHASLPTTVDEQLARTPEVVDYLETVFGPYPFDAIGGIVVNDPRVNFALENQTRPVYESGFFGRGDGSWVIAHELAHQWYGDSISLHDWSHMWLNEGFATYAEWLWNEHLGIETADAVFNAIYDGATNPRVWNTPPGAPGRGAIFSSSVYTRGAMTLHALRVTVGDEAFFRILPEWSARKKDGTATTAEFVALAEEISGRQLDKLFDDWLFGTDRPPRP